MTTVYLAQPIDQASATVDRGQRTAELVQDVRDALSVDGYNVYSPAKAWTCNGNPEPAVQRINEHALKNCDALIAVLPEGIASIGVPMEILLAAQAGKPVVVITTVRSFALSNLEGVKVTDDIGQGLQWLADRVLRPEPPGELPTEILMPPEQFDELMGALDQPRRAPNDALAELVWNPRHLQPVPFQQTQDGARDLSTHYEGDAGWDLSVTQEVTIGAHGHALVPAGIRIAWPRGYWGLILPRSSTLPKYGLMINPAVIDQGWRGEYFASVWNLTHERVTVRPGDRLAQVVPMPLTAAHLSPVLGQVPDDTERGSNGFGSTDGKTPVLQKPKPHPHEIPQTSE